MSDGRRAIKAWIVGEFRPAISDVNVRSEVAVGLALKAACTAGDKLLTLIYAGLYQRGIATEHVSAVSLAAKCDAVALELEHEKKCRGFVNVSLLRLFMERYGELKHKVIPRTDRGLERLQAGCVIVPRLFESCFGEEMYDDWGALKRFDPSGDEIGKRLNDMESNDEIAEFIEEAIKARISQHLDRDELGLFELFSEHFIAGVVDSATLRRAKDFAQWYAFQEWPTDALWGKLLDLTPAEYGAIIDAKAMQVLTDIRNFIKTEAWSARLAMSIPTERSDAVVALEASLTRLNAWIEACGDNGHAEAP